MKKEYVRNVIAVLSGGDWQYREYNNRMLMDYVMDSCRKTKSVDEVIVFSDEWADFIKSRYNVNVFSGSLKDGIEYIKKNFGCKKIIFTSAVCPMASEAEYDRIFSALDEHSFVAVENEIGEKIFPCGFVFDEFYRTFDGENDIKDVLSKNDDTFILKEFPYQMEVNSEGELEKFRELYENTVVKPQNERTLGIVNYYLSADGTKGVGEWINSVQNTISEFAEKYELTSYFINSQTEGNIVYEACSKKYGDIIIKFTPFDRRFHKEWVYYHYAKPGIMADVIDYDIEKKVLVLKMIKPGFQVKLDPENEVLRRFFDFVDGNMITEEELCGDTTVPTVMGEFDDYSKAAENSGYETDFRKSMEKKARLVWEKYFEHAPKYYLHRDLHKRNILSYNDGVIAIDPMGVLGPRAFEYVIQFIIELREFPDDLNIELYDIMMSYFTKYVSYEELSAALFVFWVFKMNDYCFQKSDGFKLAGWCKKCIEKIYFDGVQNPSDETAMPKGLKKVQ